MADIFYFSSPPKAVDAKFRLSPRNLSKSFRKRKAANMDFLLQRACVAQVAEPTFCPSGIACLIPQYPYPTRPSLESPESHRNSPNDADLDEDCGGVSLSGYDEASGEGAVAERAGSSISNGDIVLAPSSVLGTHHSRPQSRGSWEEEDGRRRRFALADAQEDEALRQRLLHSTLSPGHVNQRIPYAGEDNQHEADPMSDTSFLPQHTSIDYLLALAPSQPTSRSASRLSQHSDWWDPPSIERGYQIHIADSSMDDDALAVDDHRRSYDFADFMDNWRLQYLTGKSVPAFEPGLQSSVRLGTSADQITRKDLAEHKMDIQGLRWQLLGPSRDDAIRARGLLHPSRNAGKKAFSRAHDKSLPEQDTKYRFRSFLSRHRARISHYQLRNMLAAASRNDIFYSTGNSVIRTSLTCPTIQTSVMDLSRPLNSAAGFRITCLSTSSRETDPCYRADDVLLAGGFYGEYAMLDLNPNNHTQHLEGFVNHAYNGLVNHINAYPDRRSGLLKATFCSNDCQIRLMDVKTQRLTHSFSYENAINCSAICPNGRLRVLVGDMNETYITDAERNRVLVTLKEHREHGFACAWSKDGRHVATGAQDDNILIWDARNWSVPLKRLQTVISCPRSLHFANDGTLCVAESEDVVSTHSGHDFDMRQDIHFFGSVAGVALVDGGSEMIVANADKTVGGLLSFQQTSQSLIKGTFGKQILDSIITRQQQSRDRSGIRLCDHFVDPVV